MENIKIRVHTNLDDYDCSDWKNIELSSRPLIGDLMNVRYKGVITSLRIVSIKHSITATMKPSHYLDIELHN